MKRVVLAACVLIGLSSCDSGQDTQSDPIDDTQEQNQLDGNTAPTTRDPTPQTGTGGQSPVNSPSGTVRQ